MIEAITTLLSVILTAVCTFLVWKAQNTVKKKTGIDKAMMVLMRRELRLLHARHMERGYINDEDLGEFEEVYEVYHSLGGNGQGTVWKNDVEKLERRIG